jgi:outer membrane protein TolC
VKAAVAVLFAALSIVSRSSVAWADPGLISFEEALAQILARSTTIATQEASLGATRARNLPARLAFAPSVSLSARQTQGGGALVSPYRDRQAEGVAQLNLFRWGADVKGWQAASSDEAQQQALLEDAYLRTQDGAVAALVTALQRRLEITVAQGIVKMRKDSLAIAQQRYKGGYLPLQETRKVEVDLVNAESLLADALTAEAVASAQLESLLGHSRVSTEWPWTVAFLKLTAMPAIAADIPATGDGGARLAEALGKRPDWRAAQARVDAEDARVSRAWRLLGPSLDAQGTYGYYWSDRGAGLGAAGGGVGAPQWAGTVGVQLPLFDRLSLYSDARERVFVRSSAELALEQVRRDARAEWDGARHVFVTSLDTARSRDRILGVSRKLYSDGLQRFRSGRISADELVLEQQRVYDSERLAVQGWATAHLAYSRLCKALGLRLAECRLDDAVK